MRKQFEDWIEFADRDLHAAEIMVNEDHSLTNIAAFHCQQAIEKYMKAFLVENNVPLVRIHDLIKLNEMIVEIKDLGFDEGKLNTINEVYIETRYPGGLGLLPCGMPTDKQAKEFVEYAKEVRTIIEKELNI